VFSSLAELKRAVRRAWRQITAEECKRMMASLLRRLDAVVDGGW